MFNQINTPKSWKNWSYWDQIDPAMKSVYEGPESGLGAIHKWTSNNNSVGNGSLTIIESSEPDKIEYALTFEGMGTSNGGWLLKDSGEAILVNAFLDIDLPFMGRFFPGMFMEKSIGIDFEKTIEGLKKYTETLQDTLVTAWEIEQVTKEAQPILSIKIKCSSKEFNSKLEEGFNQLSESLVVQGLKQTGNRFTIYQVWSKDSVEMEPCIPINTPGKTVDGINASILPASKALKVDYYGKSEGSELAHAYMYEWMNKNNLPAIGAPWEEYLFDPLNEPDTSKWLTKIYYPIE
ncbi:MAG: GyrI-like domain-containing protein [Bacteroidetes bacterium]|nr:GyrI-like domain-containing protein [Bacteroidota bacterium]